MARSFNDQITPREYETWQHEREMLELQMNHAKEMKLLEVEVEKLEARWSSLLKIPVMILMLPVRILFAFGYIVHAIKSSEPSESFWKLIK